MTESLPPDPCPRPKFARWLFERRLKAREVSQHLPCSHEQVRRICLPYDDPDFREPSDELKQAIEALTWGAVAVEDWDRAERRVAA